MRPNSIGALEISAGHGLVGLQFGEDAQLSCKVHLLGESLVVLDRGEVLASLGAWADLVAVEPEPDSLDRDFEAFEGGLLGPNELKRAAVGRKAYQLLGCVHTRISGLGQVMHHGQIIAEMSLLGVLALRLWDKISAGDEGGNL